MKVTTGLNITLRSRMPRALSWGRLFTRVVSWCAATHRCVATSFQVYDEFLYGILYSNSIAWRGHILSFSFTVLNTCTHTASSSFVLFNVCYVSFCTLAFLYGKDLYVDVFKYMDIFMSRHGFIFTSLEEMKWCAVMCHWEIRVCREFAELFCRLWYVAWQQRTFLLTFSACYFNCFYFIHSAKVRDWMWH